MWNWGPSVLVAQWVLFGIACVALALRYGACRRPQYGFWWDDLVMFTSMVIFLATCVTGSIAVAWGCGLYSRDVDPAMLPQATLMGIIATDLGMLSDALPKLAVALLIVRLFHPKPWIKWPLIAATILCVIFNIVLIILSFVQCKPVKYQWNRTTMEGSCWNIHIYTDFAYFTGAWTGVLDLFFGIYPMLVISQLQMQWRKKLAVMATMSLAFATFAVTTYKVATQYPQFLHAAFNATRVLGNIMLWNALGTGFTIIGGSIPTWGWVFHTRRWKNFVYFISRGQISASRDTWGGANTPEKWLFAGDGQDVAIANTNAMSTPVTPIRNSIPVTFPQRLHYSGGSTPARSHNSGSTNAHRSHYSGGSNTHRSHYSDNSGQSQSQSRRYTGTVNRPLDSLQQLERSTWYG